MKAGWLVIMYISSVLVHVVSKDFNLKSVYMDSQKEGSQKAPLNNPTVCVRDYMRFVSPGDSCKVYQNLEEVIDLIIRLDDLLKEQTNDSHVIENAAVFSYFIRELKKYTDEVYRYSIQLEKKQTEGFFLKWFEVNPKGSMPMSGDDWNIE